MKNKELVKIFKALGNERRLDILRRIAKNKKMSVGGLGEQMELSFRSVSKHLIVLYSAGLVEVEQDKWNRYYFISSDFPKQFLEFIKF